MSKVSVIVPVYNVENYIEKMLESVQAQTFKDFEVILVNDGSTDRSQEIIDVFCNSDKRFKSFYQENGGVASARNKGIELASSDYIVFYDPDDYIPKKALKKMYKVASGKKADMVVGIMEEKSLGESLIYMHSQKLAKQDRIEPTDKSFIGAWSMCHKMFSRKLLMENNIRFEKLTNAEDGVFTYCVLNCAERIYGCRTIAYNYIKRPFWLEASATQTISSKYLEGLLASHGRILEEAVKLTEKYLSPEKKEEYLQELFIRFIEGEMIKGYYRNIWRSSENIIPRLEEKTAEYREFITDDQWQEILKRHEDLELSAGFKTKEELARIPTVSLIVPRQEEPHHINVILGSIYNQQFQRFEVFIPATEMDQVAEGYVNMENLHFLQDADFEKEALEVAKGKYISIIDHLAIFTKESLRQMEEKLRRNESNDFVSMLLKNFDGEEYRQIPCLSAAFGYSGRSRKRAGIFCVYDTLFANKLFRRDIMEGYDFSQSKRKGILDFYRALSVEKLRKGIMITDLTNEDFIKRSGKKTMGIFALLSYGKNELIRFSIDRLKRYINKEDVKKFKGKFIR